MVGGTGNEIEDSPRGYVQEEADEEEENGDGDGDGLDLDQFADEEIEKGVGQKSGFLETHCGSMTVRALIGLGIAGLGGTLVADVYGMFYVDCFLRAYKLPMRVFGIGSAIFAVINTANDVAGAYLLDYYASKNGKKREDLVGLSGCLFAVSFLGPFFRWAPRSSGNGHETRDAFWDGLHFVGSLSIYDTMFSFNCILQGSIVSDNHSMTENQRIGFFALRDLVGIVAPLVVTKVGLSLFDVSDLRMFRIFAVVLVVVSSLLSGWGQTLIHHDGINRKSSTHKKRKFFPNILQPSESSSGYSKVELKASCKGAAETTNVSGSAPSANITTVEGVGSSDNGNCNSSNSNSTLGFWRVVSDFASHPNFRYWIGMEMLMEGQNTFMGNFQKTFVDQLLRREEGGSNDTDGWTDEACDWMLALLDPATQIVGLLLFLPIRRYGYARLYNFVFVTNALIAMGLLLSNGLDNANNNNTLPIAAFLCLSIVISNAMAGAGFGLAMCDMVLEMKHSHIVQQGRTNPPSLAGLFMGANALFCKPAESVLPILAASFLGENYNSASDNNVGASEEVKIVLYRLLVFPPLVCSVLQVALWSRYSLVPETTDRLRKELMEHEEKELQQRRRRRQQQHEYLDDGEHANANSHSVIEMNELG